MTQHSEKQLLCLLFLSYLVFSLYLQVCFVCVLTDFFYE